MRVVEVLSGVQLQTVVRDTRLMGNPDLLPYANSQISLSMLEIDQLVPLAKYVLEDNLQMLSKLVKNLDSGGWDLLDLPGRLKLAVGATSTYLAPPVVEEWPGEGLLIVDGLHRIWTGKHRGAESVRCLVVRNVELPLVPLPVRWQDVQKYPPGAKLRREEKRNYRFEHMNDLGERIKGSKWGITPSNLRYFFFRDLSPLGSGGERRFPAEDIGG